MFFEDLNPFKFLIFVKYVKNDKRWRKT